MSRYFAATTILTGTLLTSSMAVATNPEVSGRATLGLALKDGQLPAGLTAGDHVDIYEVSDATEACPGQPGSLLSGDAIVLNVSAPSATSSSAVADVEVALSPATAGAVACNASNGILQRRGRAGQLPVPEPGHRRRQRIPGGCDAEPEGHRQRHRGRVAMALIAVAADKGAPGVTTTALALAAVWPRPVLLAECDPAGGDLVYRFPGGRRRSPRPAPRAAQPGRGRPPWPAAASGSGSTPRS